MVFQLIGECYCNCLDVHVSCCSILSVVNKINCVASNIRFRVTLIYTRALDSGSGPAFEAHAGAVSFLLTSLMMRPCKIVVARKLVDMIEKKDH
jgi:hypothetical protein